MGRLEGEKEARAAVENDLKLTSELWSMLHVHLSLFPPLPLSLSLSPSLSLSEKQLTSAQEDLKESQELISELRQPPPDVPGADRQELLRLLDRRYIQYPPIPTASISKLNH